MVTYLQGNSLLHFAAQQGQAERAEQWMDVTIEAINSSVGPLHHV